MACYGGGSKWEQTKSLQQGVEVVVCTPVRNTVVLYDVKKNHIFKDLRIIWPVKAKERVNINYLLYDSFMTSQTLLGFILHFFFKIKNFLL